MEEIIFLAVAVASVTVPFVSVFLLNGPFRRKSINEVALENAQVAALINQTNMAGSVNANMMDAQADKVQGGE
jgi:hypothetical protein